jgi:hypothetical protein
VSAARKRPRIFVLWLSNLLSGASVNQGAGSVVSLTTYGSRLSTVYLTIESIASGHVKPRRLILWLSAPESTSSLPGSLRRLERRGLEIRDCTDFRSHKKYFPYVNSEASEIGSALVTADDDVLYPRTWLRELERHSEKHPGSVVAHRAHLLSTAPDGMRIQPYRDWRPCTSPEPSMLHLATGVSGILYPVAFQSVMRDAGDEFLAKAPRGDDLWLHFLAITHGFPIAQVSEVSADFATIPGTGATSLFAVNVAGGGNDTQIAATYTPAAIRVLRDAEFGAGLPRSADGHERH